MLASGVRSLVWRGASTASLRASQAAQASPLSSCPVRHSDDMNAALQGNERRRLPLETSKSASLVEVAAVEDVGITSGVPEEHIKVDH